MRYRQALHRTKQGNKATARAIEAPRLSDHNERRTFTMATETLYQAEYGLSLDDADTLSEKALKLKALLVHTPTAILAKRSAQ